MLAESQAASTGWLAFVALVLASSALVPLIARGLRQGIPESRRSARVVPPLRFGESPRERRSPRHAVAFHRTLVRSSLMVGIALVLIAFAAALPRLDREGLFVAIAFVVPSLIVSLHARRRDLDGRPGA